MNTESIQYEKALSTLELADGVIRVTEQSLSPEVQKLVAASMKELGGRFDKEKMGFVFPEDLIEELIQRPDPGQESGWHLQPEFVLEQTNTPQASLF